MSYRSDVGLCLTDTGKKALEAKLAALEAGTEREQIIHALLNSPSIKGKREDQESGAIAWHWEYLKWYADYEDVSFIENFLQDLEEEDYLYIKVGEFNDDTDIRGTFWDNPFGMCLLRGIGFDNS